MDDGHGVDSQLGGRLKRLRTARGVSLDALAERSGVSRSMISLVERGESSPTAKILDRLAAGLGVTLAALFTAEVLADTGPLAKRANQPTWRDPESGYVRRNLSPPGHPSPLELVEIELPPGARVAYDSAARAATVDQQVWVLNGALDLTVGEEAYALQSGDCLAFRLDRPTAFRNPGDQPTRYLVALIVGTPNFNMDLRKSN